MNNLPLLNDLRVFMLVARRAGFAAAAEEYRSGLVYGPEKPEEAPLVYALVTKDGVERY